MYILWGSPDCPLSAVRLRFSGRGPRNNFRRKFCGVNCVILRQSLSALQVTYGLDAPLVRKGFSLSDAQISRFNQRELKSSGVPITKSLIS